MNEFSEFLNAIKDGTAPEEYKLGDGGYLLEPQIWFDKKGIKSKLWRLMGRIFHRHDWYKKGQKMYNTKEVLMGKVRIE